MEMGKPENLNGWIANDVDGITVYHRPGLRAEGPIEISAGGAWIFKALSVTGIKF